MKRNYSYKRAFTIVELIIVIAVIGVLAAILIPAFSGMIAKANAKAALSDARSTLTNYLAENLAIIDGQIAASIVIFIRKAGAYYIYGYQNTGPDMGKLMQSGGNPFKYDDLAELINDYNCTNDAVLGTPAEDQYAVFLRTEPSGSGGMKSRTKGGGMDDINDTYVNLTDKLGDDLPNTAEVFDGFLIGMVFDANVVPGGGGTNPGDNPGGGETAKVIVTYADGADGDTVSGMPNPLQVEVEANKLFELPSAPTRVGYNFAGWSAAEIGGVVGPTQYAKVLTSCTITATWEAKVEYTLTFDPGDGGTFVPANGYTFTGNSITLFKGDNILNIVMNSKATKPNHDFKGWSEDGERFFLDDYSGPIQLNGNLTLTVIWEQSKYALNYDLDGGTGMGTNGGSHTMGTTVKLTTDIPTKSGYVFYRWYCEEKNMEFGAGADYIMPGKDVTLLAMYINEYTVTYLAGSGTGTPPTQEPVTPNTEITIKSADGLSREGYVFNGWSCMETGETKFPNDKVTVNSNLTFTATWRDATYFVTYAGENAPTDDTPYIEGATVTVMNHTGDRNGYQFGGWEASHGGIFQPGETFAMPKDGTTLTAIWTKLSKLTLVIKGSTANGLTLVQDENKITNGGSFVKEYLNVPEGFNIYDYLFTTPRLAYEDDLYLFRGWVNADNTALTYNENYVGAIGMPAGDATYIVAWEGNPYEVTFNLNGGSGTFNLIEFFPGDTIAIPVTAPTITGGQVFMGWERSDMVGGALIAAGGNIINAPANDIVLKAIWANPEFYVVYDINGGQAASLPANATVGCATSGTYTVPANVPTHSSQQSVFLRYASSKGGFVMPGETINYDSSFTGTTITLTVEWQAVRPITYRITNNTTNQVRTEYYPVGSVQTIATQAWVESQNAAFATPDGKEFAGWNTAFAGTGTAYQPGDSFTIITTSLILYAQWRDVAPSTITVTVKYNDTWNVETITVNNVTVPGTGTVTAADVAAACPEYWVSSTAQVTGVTQGATITFDGSRLAQPSGNSYVTYTTGTRYQVITTLAGFLKIDDTAAGLAGKYLQYNNLNLSSKPANTVYNAGTFNRVCTIGGYTTSSQDFMGVYDGGGHNITGFGQNTSYTVNTSDSYLGLFSYNKGTIKNFNLTVDTLVGGIIIGCVAGGNGGTISNVHVTITNYIEAISNSASWQSKGVDRASAIGGICGLMEQQGTIDNCSVKGFVHAYGYYPGYYTNSGGSAGGICGLQLESTTISKCWYEGEINSKWGSGIGGKNNGGIVGATFGAVSNCWAWVDYLNGYGNLGGIAGKSFSGSTLSCCVGVFYNGGTYDSNYGSITPSNSTGTVTNCYYDPALDAVATGKGTSTTLGITTPLNGFDTNIWEFEDGNLPGIKSNPSR